MDGHRPDEWRHVFASIQSLAQVDLEHLDPTAFDVVIVDEFHHAAAPAYRRLLEHLFAGGETRSKAIDFVSITRRMAQLWRTIMAGRLETAKLTFGAVLIAAAGYSGTAALRASVAGQVRDTSAQRDVSVDKVKDVSELRPVTPGQRARAKFLSLGSTSILDEFAKNDGLRRGQSVEGALPIPPPGTTGTAKSREDEMKGWVCVHPNILLGHAESRKVLLTERDRGLFTEYGIKVDRWIRPGNGESSIIVAKRGGVVEINGRLLQDPEGAQPTLSQPYVFFAQPFVDDNGYLLVSFPAMFQRKNERGELEFAPVSASYVKDLTAAVASCPPER